MNFLIKFPIYVSLHHDLHHYLCQCSGFWMWMPTFIIANVQDFGYGMPTLLIVEVPSNLPVLFTSKHTSNIPLLELTHRKLCVWSIWFCKQIPLSWWCSCFFHDDDLRVFKEIKSYLEGNRYEIWSKWVLINTLPRMSTELWGKMVSFCLLAFQSPVDSKHSLSISHAGNFIPVDSIELGNSSCQPCGWFQVLRNSPWHGEAWVVVGGGRYLVQQDYHWFNAKVF